MPTPDQLGDQVPETSSFDVGYYMRDNTTPKFGSSQTLFCKPCIKVIQQVKSLSGVLANDKKEGSKRKGEDCSMGPSKRQKMEDVDLVFKELKEKHGNTFDTPRLRLWARMVTNKIHDDLDSPPNIPAFCSTPRRCQQQSLSSAITGAANALVKAFGDTTQES